MIIPLEVIDTSVALEEASAESLDTEVKDQHLDNAMALYFRDASYFPTFSRKEELETAKRIEAARKKIMRALLSSKSLLDEMARLIDKLGGKTEQVGHLDQDLLIGIQLLHGK